MVEILPFRGILYNRGIIRLGEVIVPPYDVFDDKKKEEFFKRSQYNFARLIRAGSPDEAKQNLAQWLDKGVLVEDEQPCLYVYEQKFEVGGISKTRTALIALVKLEEFEKRSILDHEKTFQKTVDGRLELMKRIGANSELVFGVCADGGGIAEAIQSTEHSDLFYFDDDVGVRHSIASVNDQKIIESIIKSMLNTKILIADGHHRYESSLKYRNFMREAAQNSTGKEPWNYVLMGIVSEHDSGLVILPMNRLVRKAAETDVESLRGSIERYFEIKEHGKQKQDMLDDMAQCKSAGCNAFGIYCQKNGNYYVLRLKKHPDEYEELKEVVPQLRKTDVRILHSLLLEKVFGMTEAMISSNEDELIKYTKGNADADSELAKGIYPYGIFINAVSLGEIFEVSNAGYVMERKTTCFYPKLYSGLVMSLHRVPLDEHYLKLQK